MIRRGFVLLLLVFVLPGVTRVQGQETRSAARERAADIDEKELAKYLQRQEQVRLVPQALETPIDPASYLVGPGDVLIINFWGPTSDELGFSATITPEGMLILPSVGTLDVNHLSLQQVQEAVRRACAAKYDPRSINVTAHLTQLRLVRAHVYGEVTTPGSYAGTAIDRISYFITQAENATQWADERHVQVRHADGTVDTLNFTRLRLEGDLSQDLFVRGGDVIYVPPIELTAGMVTIEGPVALPGPHQLAKDETLLEFLYRVKALHRWSELNEIYVMREGREPLHVNFFADGAAAENAHRLQLQHGDHIMVSSRREYVYVHGAVKNPGNFQFIVGYRAADYVGLAGGSQEMADIRKVKVIRRDTGKVEVGANTEVRRGDTLIVPVSGRTKFSEYLSITSQIATILIAASAVGIVK